MKPHGLIGYLLLGIFPIKKHNKDKDLECLPDFIDLPNPEYNQRQKCIKSMLIPAQIICLLPDKHGELYAIIHSCLQYREKMSVLTYRWQLEYQNMELSINSNTQYNNDV